MLFSPKSAKISFTLRGKALKPSIKSNPKNRLANQEKFEERESWHKLVVKVIIWKDKTRGDVNGVGKISSKEWKTYCKQTLKNNANLGKQKILTGLKQTRQLIKENNGFESDVFI